MRVGSPRYRSGFCTAVARFAGSIIVGHLILGLTPQALCFRLLRRLKNSYAISLGLLNGDLFKGVMAFSPGFVIEGPWVGKPRFYISHGKQDRILPIEKCGRRIAADVNAHAYGVTLKEFDGGHEIPADVLRESFRWLGSL